ncbi:MAG: copper homeostasis protein CutC [Bacteroidetes Order II. Incertae sedis bacterium]|nr:copper homeostasis protein CutC [Bacteroidetes Order II. bacterium]
MTLEICAANFQSAMAAMQGGAHRIELCENLSEGGTTPSLGMIRHLKRRLNIPIMVLIRPRGGDFCYQPDELAVMLEDIHICKSEGVEGVVLGALAPDGTIDTEACYRMLDAAQGMETVFHRAFDLVPDEMEALKILVYMGFTRILTSGLAHTAFEGIPNLVRLIREAQERITILPGGGITSQNALAIAKKTGATELHASLRKRVERTTGRATSTWMETDVEEVRRLLKITENASKI